MKSLGSLYGTVLTLETVGAKAAPEATREVRMTTFIMFVIS